MDLDYFTEDGHHFSKEDYEEFVLWKIKELKEQGYEEEEIICFDDNRNWRKLANNKFNRS